MFNCLTVLWRRQPVNQLERITFELNILKDALTLAQDNLTKHEIPAARGDPILAKYQTQLQQLSTSLTHRQQLQQLQHLETQRQQLMQLHHSQLAAIQQAINELKEFGVKTVDVHDDPPPFTPHMVRAAAAISYDPDWAVQQLGSNQKKNLMHSVHRGASSDLESTSFVPALMAGENLGETWPKL